MVFLKQRAKKLRRGRDSLPRAFFWLVTQREGAWSFQICCGRKSSSWRGNHWLALYTSGHTWPIVVSGAELPNLCAFCTDHIPEWSFWKTLRLLVNAENLNMKLHRLSRCFGKRPPYHLEPAQGDHHDHLSGGGTWVRFCWVCAAGLSEPLPHAHYSLFCGQL